MKKILLIVGTRPELIKVAPLVHEIIRRNVRDKFLLVNTAQHQDLLDPYWKVFGIQPDITLDVMQKDQSLSSLTIRVIEQFQKVLDSMKNEVFAILAQGDTTTVLGVSMVAFYNRILFYHLEAGLRSFNLENPYPEEFNRRVASLVSAAHFCPTSTSRENLILEGIPEEKIFVVGNTVIDSLRYLKENNLLKNGFDNSVLDYNMDSITKYVLITCHRRENQGSPLTSIIQSVCELAHENESLKFVWVLHPNPNVRNVILQSDLINYKNILIVEPLNYFDLIKILSRSIMAISDSGGIQEEAPTFNVPVLVLRETTERPEGLDAGAAFLVGSNKELIRDKFKYFLTNTIKIDKNPYGDGQSSKRVVDYLLKSLNY